MMAGYRRTISFPAPKPATDGGFSALATASDKLAAYRVRSASLPCRFHPLLRQLDDDVAALRLVIGQSPPCSSSPTASSVSAAASQVGRVLVSLSDLLHHPQAQDPLRRLARWPPLAERLLDDFLRLADTHGSFRQSLVALASLSAETRAALRRGGDPARLASASRAQRRAARDLPRLAAAVRAVAAKAHLPLPPGEDLPADSAALAAAVSDATVAVASGSAAVFSGLSSLSNSAASARVEVASTPCWATASAKLAAGSSSDAPRGPRAGGHHRVWWVADLVRWMSRAKRRSAEKQHGGSGEDEDESSTVQLRSEARAKPEERARRAALELHENLERCIASVDASGEKVFRALVNTRVSLLNILSPSF